MVCMSVYANMRQFVHTNTARRAVSGGFLPCKKNWRRRRFCQASVWNAIRVRVTWFMALSEKTSRQTGAKEDDAFCYVRYSKQRRTVLPNISRALLDFFINNQSSLFCTRRSSFGFDSNFKARLNYSLEMIGSTGKKVISFYTVHRKCWLAVSLFLFFKVFCLYPWPSGFLLSLLLSLKNLRKMHHLHFPHDNPMLRMRSCKK